MEKPRFPLTVFYDGNCVVCATEMKHYREKAPIGLLEFVDISASDFDPADFERSRDEYMEQLHVRDAEGRYYTAVDGFWAIWQAFPASSVFGFLGRLVQLPVVRPLARLCYRIFAWLRKYLPKYRDKCGDDGCPLDHSR